MKRRDLLAGALAAMTIEGQDHNPGTLYIPKPHLVEDRDFLHNFMDEFSFVELVTAAPAIRITHIPVLLDRTAGKYGTIFGHVSRQNPQNATFDGRQTGVIVFRGPHSYISPTWYTKSEVVPTWNFAVVHATGKLNPIPDKKTFHDLLGKLIAKFEKSSYDFEKLPESYTSSLIAGIVGFQMEIEQLEGKFKLGQERSAADKERVLHNLESAKPERSIHDFTASFYQRVKSEAGD